MECNSLSRKNMVLQFLKKSFSKLTSALKKSSSYLKDRLSTLFSSAKVDADLIERLEEIFFEADLGVQVSQELAEKTRLFLKKNKEAQTDEILQFLRQELELHLIKEKQTLTLDAQTTVILVVGVNGNGKTSSIAKLANLFKKEGKKVLLAAADTFRAGAQEQLEIWADRIGIDCVLGQYKSDPAAVVFDACQKALSKNYDVLLVDTAGRLENKSHLMKELEKIGRSCKKLIPDGPHETLLVMDATVGQHGLEQAKAFHGATPLSGIILTKLDGTARGGTAFSIQRSLNIPIVYITLGEQVDDIQPFNAKEFVEALLPL
jgi:fused signal recognition particle receptor